MRGYLCDVVLVEAGIGDRDPPQGIESLHRPTELLLEPIGQVAHLGATASQEDGVEVLTQGLFLVEVEGLLDLGDDPIRNLADHFLDARILGGILEIRPALVLGAP